jgi:hypothetical protein
MVVNHVGVKDGDLARGRDRNDGTPIDRSIVEKESPKDSSAADRNAPNPCRGAR